MWELIRWKRSLKKLFFYFFIYTGQKSETWLFRALHSHNPFYAPLRSVLNMCHWHIAPWHHVMYRKKELAVCSASSFKQKIKSAEGGTWTRTVLLPQAPEACASANSATSAYCFCEADSQLTTHILLHGLTFVNTFLKKNKNIMNHLW